MTKIILTDELRAEILDLKERGFSVQSICDKVAISIGTYYRLQEDDSDFLEACQRARRVALKRLKSSAEQCVAAKIEKQEPDSWRAGAWFLSHRHPSEYAERRIQDNSHDLSSPFDRLLEVMVKKDIDKPETEKQ